MIGIFVANTSLKDGNWKRIFTFSWYVSMSIKIFTWYEFKELIKKYPKLKDCTFKDTPTHTLFGDINCDGEERLIFESSVRQQLNYYYECRWEFEFLKNHRRIYDPVLFHKVSRKTIGQWYAVLQLIYFIRRWFWCVPFKWLLPTWAKLFHGGKNIKLWGNWFTFFDICTEQTAKFIREKADKYMLLITRKFLCLTNINNFSPTGILEIGLGTESVGESIER